MAINKVLIERSDGSIAVTTPFSEKFNKRLRELGGRFNRSNRRWEFPLEAEDSLRDELHRFFGVYDGTETSVNLVIHNPAERDIVARFYNGRKNAFVVCGLGREIASAKGRDSGAMIGDSVIVHRGGFQSGGSQKNFRVTQNKEDTLVEIKDVPLDRAQELAGSDPNVWVTEPKEIRSEQLAQERRRLLARIAEIDEEIEKNEMAA